ncbi:MAG: peptide ABC transporter substrate-binding protein [Blastopirellula sp.]|nr:MAG: peptide ABC transporter substrate-binding protein [Blastopirellula sp.]
MLGCSSDDLNVTKGSDANSNTTTTATSLTDEDLYKPILLPFDAPPLAELDAKVTWVDQPVWNPYEILKDKLDETEPLTEVKTALSLRNDYPISKVNNEKIKSALGRGPISNKQVDYEATLTRRVGGDAKTTNPIMVSSTTDFDVSSLINMELFGFDWNMTPFANSEYVKSWQTSESLLYEKITLRNDIYWEDGTQVTAHDVVFSFQTILNPEIPIPATRTGTDLIRWIEAYDDFTIIIFHPEASPVNIWNINFPVIAKHIYEKTIPDDKSLKSSDAHRELEKNPLESGPYRLIDRSFDQELVFERREEYYMVNGKQVRDKPYFKKIRLRIMKDPNTAIIALKSGEIEEMEITAEHWNTQANDDDFYKLNTKATATEWVSFHFCWNCKSKFFQDLKVRQAMGFAFDHEELLDKMFKGLYAPSNGPFHPKAWMAPKNPPPFLKQDLDKAEDLLDEAGWGDSNFDGVRDKMINGKRVDFEFNVLCSQSPTSKRVSTLLKESLDQIGIICHVKTLEFTVLQQYNLDGNFDATFGGWGTGTDPYLTENIFGTGKKRNYGKYSSAKVDQLYKQGLAEFDKEKRAAIYGDIHQTLYADQPYTWLFYRNSFYGFNKRLRGYYFSPRGPYNYNPGFYSVWAAASE